MKISYNLRLEDVIALQKHLLLQSKQNIFLKKITQLSVPIILASLIVIKIINKNFVSQTQIVLFGLLALTWIVLHHLSFEKIMFRKVKKTVLSQKNSLGLGKNSVEITKNGIDFWQNKENLLLPFTRFAKVDQTPNHLFLIVGKFAGITINTQEIDIKKTTKFVQQLNKKLK